MDSPTDDSKNRLSGKLNGVITDSEAELTIGGTPTRAVMDSPTDDSKNRLSGKLNGVITDSEGSAKRIR